MTQRLQIGFVFVLMHLSAGYLTFPNFIYMLTDKGHWEVVLCLGFLQLILIWIYIKGLNYFPKKDVIDIYLKMGRMPAIIFLTPFVINLTALVAFNIRSHTEAINSIFLLKTPYWPVLMLLFFISTYTAIKGLDTILRFSIFIFFSVIPLLIFIFFSSAINFDLQNASPVWQSSLSFLLNINFFYLIGFSAFLFLGFMTSETKITFGQIIGAWTCVILLVLANVYTPIFIFGQETVVTLSDPFIKGIDSVDIKWFVFNRQTMFFGLSFIGFMIVYNAIMLWTIGQIMQKISKWRKAKTSYWIISFSFIAFFIALFVPNQDWIKKYLLWSTGFQVYSMIIIPFSIFIYGLFEKRGMTGYEKN